MLCILYYMTLHCSALGAAGFKARTLSIFRLSPWKAPKSESSFFDEAFDLKSILSWGVCEAQTENEDPRLLLYTLT